MCNLAEKILIFKLSSFSCVYYAKTALTVFYHTSNKCRTNLCYRLVSCRNNIIINTYLKHV